MKSQSQTYFGSFTSLRQMLLHRLIFSKDNKDYKDYNDYNDYSDYNDYNNYNDYRDSD